MCSWLNETEILRGKDDSWWPPTNMSISHHNRGCSESQAEPSVLFPFTDAVKKLLWSQVLPQEAPGVHGSCSPSLGPTKGTLKSPGSGEFELHWDMPPTNQKKKIYWKNQHASRKADKMMENPRMLGGNLGGGAQNADYITSSPTNNGAIIKWVSKKHMSAPWPSPLYLSKNS